MTAPERAELDAALDEWEKAGRAYTDMCAARFGNPYADDRGMDKIDRARGQFQAARSRLVALYEKLEHMIELRDRAIDSLRESSLTPEEARIIHIEHVSRCGYNEWDCHCTPEARSARAKIRRLSGESR